MRVWGLETPKISIKASKISVSVMIPTQFFIFIDNRQTADFVETHQPGGGFDIIFRADGQKFLLLGRRLLSLFWPADN